MLVPRIARLRRRWTVQNAVVEQRGKYSEDAAANAR